MAVSVMLPCHRWPAERASWESRLAHRDAELESAFATIAHQRSQLQQLESISSIAAEHAHYTLIVQQHQTHCKERMEQWNKMCTMEAEHKQCQETIQVSAIQCIRVSTTYTHAQFGWDLI